MKKITENIALGEPITNLMDLQRLSKEGKSVILHRGYRYEIRPAAFYFYWPLAQLMNCNFYYSIKL